MYVGPSAHFSFDGMTPTCLNQDKSQAAKDFRVLVITSSCLAKQEKAFPSSILLYCANSALILASFLQP